MRSLYMAIPSVVATGDFCQACDGCPGEGERKSVSFQALSLKSQYHHPHYVLLGKAVI